MSAISYITSIPLFQGAQGKYYVVDGYKYHPCFPIEWAMNHLTFRVGKNLEDEEESGPIACGNCASYGSIRGVFVGYCSNCLRAYEQSNIQRGVLIAPGIDVGQLENSTIWQQYPYMYGVKKSEIGDNPNARVTDEGIDMEKLYKAMDLVAVNQEDDENEPFVHNPYDSEYEELHKPSKKLHPAIVQHMDMFDVSDDEMCDEY